MNAIEDLVGKKGTILVPTYSYSFKSDNKKRIFDVNKTKSEIGPFPNYFLKQKKVYRNIDPMVSIAGKGFLAKKILTKKVYNSYGVNSVFHRLLEIKNCKILNIGLGPNWIPFIHYADFTAKVDHRFDKVIEGNLRINGKLKKISWLYYSRVLVKQTKANAYNVGYDALKKKKIWNYVEIGRARMYLANYKSYYKFTISKLKKNKWALARGPKVNLIKEDRKKIIKKKLNNNLHNYILDLDGFNLATEQILKLLNRKFKIQIKKYKTGYKFLNYLIPERTTKLNNRIIRTFDEIKIGIKKNKNTNIVLIFYLKNLNEKRLLFIQKYVRKIFSEKKVSPEIVFTYDYNGYFSYLSENFKNKLNKTFFHINFSAKKSFSYKNINFNSKNKLIFNMKNHKINYKDNVKNFEIEGNYPDAKKKLSNFSIKEIFYELDTSESILQNYNNFFYKI